MKRLILVLSALLFSLSVSAQGLTLSVVNDRSEPLPYVYIYLNGQAAAVSDEHGITKIEEKRLKLGDIISASYVGTEPVQFIYTDEIRKQGSYRLILGEVFGTLQAEEVVVTGSMESFFWKSLQKKKPVNFNALLKADFVMKLEVSDTVQLAAGKLSVGHWTDNPAPVSFFHSIYYNLPASFETASDISEMEFLMQREIHVGAGASTRQIDYINAGSFNFYKPVYKYFGIHDHCRVFRITYPDVKPEEGLSYQILVWLDEQTGIVKRSEMHIFNRSYAGAFCITVDYALYNHKRPKIHALVPTGITYTVDYLNDDIGVWYTLTNVETAYHPWDKKTVGL